MRAINRLSAPFVKSAPVGKHCDGAGLWFIKREDGGAQWMLRATVHGRRREMGLGGQVPQPFFPMLPFYNQFSLKPFLEPHYYFASFFQLTLKRFV